MARKLGYAIIVAGSALTACVTAPDTASGRAQPACNDPVISMAVDQNDPQYRVISPNGGEAIRAGEPCTLRVTSMHEGRAQLFLSIGPENFDIPGLDRSIGTPDDSLYVFIVPRSIAKSFFDPALNAVRDSMYPIVSDSCRIRIVDYYERTYGDVSDCLFSITDR